MVFLGTMNVNGLKSRIGKDKKKFTHISLFTGVGGFDLGFAAAGAQSRVMVEWDKYCCATLRANWHWSKLKQRKDHKGKIIWKNKAEMKKVITHYHDREPVILQADITKLPTKEILEAAELGVGEANIVSGGPPCQGFSTAGKRMIDDPRNSLYKSFVRVVKEALPVFFVMENVPGFVSMKQGEIIKQIIEDFSNCGYEIIWDILNAADYGVPQYRRRVFIIGKRIDVLLCTAGMKRPQLHLGAVPGKINHPDWFRKKHGMVPKGQQVLGDYKRPRNFVEMLQQFSRNSSSGLSMPSKTHGPPKSG